MKKLLLAFLIVPLISTGIARADEGMWLLPYLSKYNIKDMKKAGFKLTAEDIYSINNSSLKDAIVIFGRGCTGEIVSSEGLLFTNHHCGYGNIQALSTVEKNYLENGFWAKSHDQELPSEGLTAQFVREIKDVTDQVLEGTTLNQDFVERDSIISAHREALIQENSNREENLRAIVQPMFGGNQYIMYVYETFGDVRLVGTPPQSVGKYGGDTDNWMWPRHTGDFSIFRVYASKDNKSTKGYSADNVPYTPKKHLTISTKGVKEGDFTMIMGFPGGTDRYMTTWEVDNTLEVTNPLRVEIRGAKQDIWWADMMADEKVHLQYASKFASSSNYWKNAIGMSRGLTKLNIRDRKDQEQEAFMAWVNEDPSRVAKYGKALEMIERATVASSEPLTSYMVVSEVLSGAEAYTFSLRVADGLESEATDEALIEAGEAYFKNYNAPTDKRTTLKMFEKAASLLEAGQYPSFLSLAFPSQFDEIFDNSPFTSRDRYMAAVENHDLFKNDVILNQAQEFLPFLIAAAEQLDEFDTEFSEGHRLYLAGLMEMNQGKKVMYPDANFTIRLTYGTVEPYKAADAVYYDYVTTIDGMIAKADPTNPDFDLDPALYELWKNKDYGRWAVDGTVPVGILSTNDITGGNSGSPIMNARGELIGLAFDGNWEAMSGDIAFEPDLQRTISVDIRYVLFIVEKLGGATNIIDELTLN